MTYYLYRLPNGVPELLTHPLPPQCPDGTRLIRTTQERVDVVNMRFNENDELVPVALPYTTRRRMAYPRIGDQLDALWHAMDQGTLPKAEPFYSDIKAVKDANPKPSN
jgi:hypothetical protein